MKQKWVKELVRSVAINPQFMLWGNIYDIYPLQTNQGLKPLRLNQYLAEVLANEEYDLVLYFEPLFGLTILHGSEEDAQLVSGENIYRDKPTNMTLLKFIVTLERIDLNKDIATATIFNFSSRNEQSFSNEILNEFYYKAFRILHNSTPKKTINSNSVKYNVLIYLFDKDNDIPAWYTTNNPKIKSIPIPKPDLNSREIIIQQLSRRINGYSDLEETKRHLNETLFIEQTNGLYISEILSIISLAVKEKVPFENIGQAINMYKLGIVENEWEKVSKEKLIDSENILSKRVMGQMAAIGKTSDILKRAYFNLSGSQYSKNSNRPKGVMFFAGPTGVGKTELAKAITELVFGSENNYIRFDMSEFSQENANQRLVGAPPGYVGYETGGELTNAVKENPFTVILFDEIEKAHPKIMDIFLQILDDGRLTSGRGETVYLSETIIIFTSNLGVYGITDDNQRVVNTHIEMDYKTIQQSILSSISDYFKFKLQRPEILNRIGENVVVFDYIRPEIAQNIFSKMLSSVLGNLQENHKISIEFDLNIKAILEKACLEDLGMGGRGIGNHLENVFINPLSRILFELDMKSNETLIINNISQIEAKWIISASKKSI